MLLREVIQLYYDDHKKNTHTYSGKDPPVFTVKSVSVYTVTLQG